MTFGRLARGSAILTTIVVLASCSSAYDNAPSKSDGSASPGSPGASVSSLTSAEFVDTICLSVIAWVNTVKIHLVKLTHQAAAADKSGSDTAKRQKVLVAYLGQVVSDSEQLILGAQSIGAPNVSNGAAVQAQLIDAFTKVRDVFFTAKQNIAALSSDDSAAIKQAIDDAAHQLKTTTRNIATAMAGLSSQELKDAYKSDAACSALRKA
jgi:hypothetical protein